MAETIIRPGAPASGRLTPASFPFYTTGEDNLRVTSWNTLAGVKVKINGRLIDAAGKTNADSWDHTPNTDGTAASSDLSLSGSSLLNVTIFAGAGSPPMGRTLVKLELIRGLGASALVLGTILLGFVTGGQAIGFPGSPIQNALDGPGAVRAFAGADPAHSATFVATVPAGRRWQLLALSHQIFVGGPGTSGTPYVTFSDDTPRVFGGASSGLTVNAGAPVASLYYTAGATGSAPPIANTGFAPLPTTLLLLAGWSFTINVANVGAIGWDITGVGYMVREWLDV